MGNSQENKLENIAEKLYKTIKNENNIKLAIMEFPYTDSRKSEGPIIIQERMTTIFAQKENISLIERNLLKKILEELKIQESGIVDLKDATKIGNILGADYLLLGTLNDIEKSKTEINSRIVEVKTGKIISASSGIIEKTWKDSINNSQGNDYSGKSLVQIAILLDTSNSMDGLINQAKTYLWKIVNELNASEKNGQSPIIEIALYEYGNNSLPKEKGYIRQVSDFTSDLDKVSKELFNLKTNGGEEYCGWVIKEAVENLKWSKKDDVYKAIFIAGNEAFTQGPINFEESVNKAKSKGIFVNTIFCGPKQEGIALKWKSAAEISEGDFTNIDQNIQIADISAPQDDKIAQLNSRLNETYIPYGKEGKAKLEEKKEMDTMTFETSKSMALERASFQANSVSALKTVSQWDIISAIESGKMKKSDIKKEELPDELKNMSDEQLSKYIDEKIAQRQKIKQEISRLSQERKKYIEEIEKQNSNKTLDKAIINSLRKQAEKKGYKFKN